ncbi:MAG: hypothetical protein WD941_07340, partial [Opitutus sp.]
MTRIPPLLPAETLLRVLRTAQLDGICVVVLAAIFALVSAAGGHFPFAIIGLMAAAAGSVELQGRGMLLRGDAKGMNWLVASQPFLLLVIYAYCLLRLHDAHPPAVPESVQAVLATSAAQFGMTVGQYLAKVNRLTIQIFAVIATICQGGMA